MDVTLLDKTNWLSDSQVSFGMKLIQEQFPHFNILTASPYWNYNANKFSLDNLLIDDKGNHVIKDGTFFILHSLERHWVNLFLLFGNIDNILTYFIKVLLTNYDGDLDEWHLYDSLNEEGYRKSISVILGEISKIFPETYHMFLNNRDVQRQEGINDCGLFALAYMYTLCSGNNPSLCAYTQSKMRDHYNNCIKNKIFEAFPHTSLKRKHINDKKHEYNVKKDKWES